jgi:tRNA G18 (ribose-2'-O)-methylase SpoU
MGTVLLVPFATIGWLDEGISLLHRNGFHVAALTPTGERELSRTSLIGKVAILLGSEGPGLTPAALQAADLRVRIPMANGVDSLNVATAAAIAFASLDGAVPAD